MTILLNILILAVAVFVVAKILPAVHVESFMTSLGVAIVYSLVNFFIGWLLVLISLPFLILTFWLFKFVLNAIMLWITDKFIEGFEIENFGWTLVAALLISLIDSVIRWVVL
jgi:putative membrane protein